MNDSASPSTPSRKFDKSVTAREALSLIEVRETESVVGQLQAEVDTRYQDKTVGVLYAGTKGLLFQSTQSFLFDKRWQVEWSQVCKVTKVSSVDDMHGGAVEVSLRQDDDSKRQQKTLQHLFTNLHNADRVWAILVSLHNDSLLDKPASARRRSSISPSMLKRRNSDPAGIMMTGSQDILEGVDKAEEYKTAETRPPPPTPPRDLRQSFALLGVSSAGSSLTMSHRANLNFDKNTQQMERHLGALKLGATPCSYRGAQGKLYAGECAVYFVGKQPFIFWDKTVVLINFGHVKAIQMDKERRGVTLVPQDNGEMHVFEQVEQHDAVWAALIALHNDFLLTADSETIPRQRLRRRNSDPMFMSDTKDDMLHESVRSTGELTSTSSRGGEGGSVEVPIDYATYKEEGDFDRKVIQNLVIPVSIERFQELFLQDNATYSIAHFMEGRGDTQLAATAWSPDDTHQKSRVIRYRHPINAPLAPPDAAARKEQCLRRFACGSVSLETTTVVDDVPMADCFRVTDRVRAEPSNDDSSVKINMEFRITFIKSTMFKAVIAKTTTSEFTAFFESLADYMSKAAGNQPMAPSTSTEIATTRSTTRTERSQGENSQLLPLHMLLFVVVVMQAWMLLELRYLNTLISERIISNYELSGVGDTSNVKAAAEL